VLLVCGAGEEAWWHVQSLSLVRPFERVLVWNRTPQRAVEFAARARAELDLPCEASSDLAAAVQAADIVCTTTAAAEPYLEGAWLQPGTHLTLVGSAVPHTAEVDTATVAAARFYVDYREAARQQAGELLRAIRAGAVDEGHIAGEIGEVLLGRVPGRRSRQEITLYKSLGVTSQDLAAAHHVYLEARTHGVGTQVDLAA
jgi:ornithine cyclodeaminase/alanine dehydrogenase-like protein (mu-crystallin family)